MRAFLQNSSDGLSFRDFSIAWYDTSLHLSSLVTAAFPVLFNTAAVEGRGKNQCSQVLQYFACNIVSVSVLIYLTILVILVHECIKH